ncbi:MAG: hypothetical protein M0Q22_05920 [Sulfuritalea sp.]|jgi:hypothetical protein|nr:hypothetical protein [Sulfuritalea sp.]
MGCSSESTGADEMAVESRSGAAAAPLAAIPTFKYNLSDIRKSHYGCILADGEVYHRVGNANDFFTALGYTEKIRKSGLLLDEFLWERYNRNGAAKSEQCLQVQIAAYLHKHSANFRNAFGSAYQEMIGKCISDAIDNGDDHCLNCPRHPQFAC